MELFWIILLIAIPVGIFFAVWFFTKKVKPDAQHGAWEKGKNEAVESRKLKLTNGQKVLVVAAILLILGYRYVLIFFCFLSLIFGFRSCVGSWSF